MSATEGKGKVPNVKGKVAKGKGKGHNKMIKKKEQRINYNLVNEVHSVYYFNICL